ncbi:transposase, IS66 family [Bathymodiolus platifrons methanotrophic gill symbiont]|uniref:IS66 family insertion sequence element accessory protein TnpA n=1 Tax=Bathymodiolus platifrons methanotrophic gill symbiont TaxID=113268 RepID=UPI001B461389|nr:hypothetical protein [Bathymodiolus platifrons methanotrophic gill symbiont]GFO73833.1 transposase, IS66 family [Bathymodiolus platifrons methanotrophic gill symbiont]GFO74140.1 transposase, IS66 family [Bathymodiolus platifrons methanotrophic gill symbiont]GFO74416.1 transposase, IS66 family [Bathymodiolus platifrons methanotrophic gill symbiont]GFO75494.1 transposase, IS66 family [Bathymodiolus platifrons methanotrophic gill symbiont]GFO75891.1 transposase, IS66 family [Bathymodiolus plat
MADYCFQLTQEALMSPSQNKSAMQDPIPQWQASSLTQVEYCKAHDIKPHIFSYYKKQFSSATSSVKQSSQLVPVKLVTEDTLIGSRLSAGLSVIKITHSNGFSLEILADTELSSLKPLLELLRSVS